MRNALLLFCLCPCFVFGQSTNDSIPMNKISFIKHIDSLIDISLDTKVLNWHDSTKVVFLTITYVDDKYDQKHLNFGITKKYRNLSGPIIVGNIYIDSCLVYPIQTKGNTSYFLFDDFKHLKYSKISLSISCSVGEYDKNQVDLFFEFPSIELSKLTTIISSIAANPNNILATNEWYESWFQNNPSYRDQRIRNINNQCK